MTRVKANFLWTTGWISGPPMEPTTFWALGIDFLLVQGRREEYSAFLLASQVELLASTPEGVLGRKSCKFRGKQVSKIRVVNNTVVKYGTAYKGFGEQDSGENPMEKQG